MYSGKDYFAKKIIDMTNDIGYTIFKTAFANRLKYHIRNGMGLTKFGLIDDWNYLDSNKRLLYDLMAKDYYAIYGEFPDSKVHCKNIYDSIFNIRNTIVHKYNNDGIFDVEKMRTILQKYGTEVIRDNIGENFWKDFVLYCFNTIKNFTDYAIITDYRFPSEVIEDAIKIRINCSIEERSIRSGISINKLKELSLHSSEYYIPSLKVDFELDSTNSPNYSKFIEENILR
jgi:hypothetical protein